MQFALKSAIERDINIFFTTKPIGYRGKRDQNTYRISEHQGANKRASANTIHNGEVAMIPKVETMMREILALFRKGIGQYILTQYKQKFQGSYMEAIKSNVRSFTKLRGSEDEKIISALDTQACIDLILKEKQLFWNELGHVGIAYLSELMDFRIKLAHEHPITNEDAYRAADTVKRILEMVDANRDVRIEAYKKATDLFFQISDHVVSAKDSPRFSEEIRTGITAFKKTIDTLTVDQFRIIEWLRGQKKAVIQGCAGSGKTLVAAEKAIRLAKAGLNTLILCHNYYLAEYFKKLMSGTGVDVYDFSYWTALQIEGSPKRPRTWTPYEEPTQEDIDCAFDKIAITKNKYDAIIVDEGQDFREIWWLTVEASLKNPEQSVLYIFSDDNQSLLPRRSDYPVPTAPYSLSKNCRNSGKIFKLVKQFHPQAPDPSAFLERTGVFKMSTFSKGEEVRIINRALLDAFSTVSVDELIILTTEHDPARDSILNGFEIEDKPPFSWQEAVQKYLEKLIHTYSTQKAKSGKTIQIQPPSLSNRPFPKEDDIAAVSAFARDIGKAIFKKWEGPTLQKGVVWRMSDQGFSLTKESAFCVLNFFAIESWPLGLPRIPRVCITADPMSIDRSSLIPIQLQTVASFKGLESDAVILFIRSPRPDLEAALYVGLSRARYFLHLLIDSKSLERVPALQAEKASKIDLRKT